LFLFSFSLFFFFFFFFFLLLLLLTLSMARSHLETICGVSLSRPSFDSLNWSMACRRAAVFFTLLSPSHCCRTRSTMVRFKESLYLIKGKGIKTKKKGKKKKRDD
jgi:hypothetical protein